MSVKVRFAPSPTGNVHIGNIRAAIFNWLFARHAGGRFLLRIENTDRERSTPEAIGTLLDAMEWLGLDCDGPPVYQSERRQAHLDAAEKLLRDGAAYREDKGGSGRGECIVFRMPESGTLSFDDAIKGTMTKSAEDAADVVIVRSDGSPVFHLANVVDDIAMGITHVIRGDDHVENTFRHVALFRALGVEPPCFAHLPMIVNDQGKPYSKRDGVAFVGEFREQGFLPEALFNYLALLGWSPGEDREIMTREEMIDLFTLDRVKSAAARFDFRKLLWMNGAYMRDLPREVFAKRFQHVLDAAGMWAERLPEPLWEGMVNLLQPRIKLDRDMPSAAACYLSDNYPFDCKAVRKRLDKPGVRELLSAMADQFEALGEFSEQVIESAMRTYCEAAGLSFGSVVHPVRVAVSGSTEGAGLFEMLALIGRERVVRRLRNVADRLRMGTL